MNYQSYNKNKKRKQFFWLVLIAGTVFYLLGSWLVGIRVDSGGAAVASGGHWAWLQVFTTDQDLIDQNRQLRAELAARDTQARFVKETAQAYRDLAEQVFQDRPKTLAGVVSKPPISPYGTYLIDAGSQHDVAIGDFVVYGGVVTVGQVVAVWERSAKVQLYSAYGVKTTASVGGNLFEMYGLGSGLYQVAVPRDFQVEIGESIRVPAGRLWVLGTVVDTVVQPQDALQQVIVQVPVNLQSVELVEIFNGYDYAIVESFE